MGGKRERKGILSSEIVQSVSKQIVQDVKNEIRMKVNREVNQQFYCSSLHTDVDLVTGARTCSNQNRRSSERRRPRRSRTTRSRSKSERNSSPSNNVVDRVKVMCCGSRPRRSFFCCLGALFLMSMLGLWWLRRMKNGKRSGLPYIPPITTISDGIPSIKMPTTKMPTTKMPTTKTPTNEMPTTKMPITEIVFDSSRPSCSTNYRTLVCAPKRKTAMPSSERQTPIPGTRIHTRSKTLALDPSQELPLPSSTRKRTPTTPYSEPSCSTNYRSSVCTSKRTTPCSTSRTPLQSSEGQATICRKSSGSPKTKSCEPVIGICRTRKCISPLPGRYTHC